MFRILFVFKNLFFIFHIGFGTKHFGINNKIWVKDHSVFSVPFYKGLFLFPNRFKMMKKRAFMGFLPFDDAKKLFPGYARKNYRNDFK
ncbi:MAG: hypothetical protein H6681_02860 [Desulfobacteraceae bacterium]|nr:hypothetical protein [Desulfobacteraceae bacterium]